MKLPKFKKKALAIAAAGGLALGAAGISAAFFSAGGSGTGTLKTGHADSVKIQQIGPGYNSLLTTTNPDPYSDSQCFIACDNFKEIGDQVTLARGTSYAQLISVTVALVNFGAQRTSTVTLNLIGGPNGTYSFTTPVNIAPGSSQTQTVTLVTFNLAQREVFVNRTFIYGIELTNTTAVNIAMSSRSQLTVGSSPAGTVYIARGAGPFAPTTTTWTTGLVPAVQFNVVGGQIGPLYPTATTPSPVEFAVTNPGASGAYLKTVSATLGTLPAGCFSTWFSVTGSPDTVNKTFPPGLTVVTTSTLKVRMVTNHTTQDSCATKTFSLQFTGSAS